jgi:hypothetical protein
MDITMTTLPFSRKTLPIAMLTTLLAACGGGGGDSGASTSTPTTSTITGTASKGTLKNAIVTAYKIKDDGTKGDKIGETKTDASGQYALPVTNYTGAVLLELSSDTNTKMACDIAIGCGEGNAFGSDVSINLALSSVLASAQGNPKSSITPFTHMATEFALSKVGGLKKTNIDSAFSQIQQLFDLPDLQNTILADATKTLPQDLDIQRYALLNAAIGQLATNISDIRSKIDALVTQLKINNGQLKSSEAGTDNIKDLADVLKAAQTVADSNKLVGLNSLIKAAVKEHLQQAQANTGNTNIQPTDNAGTTDLAKAKAFVSSIKQLVNKAQDLKSLESSLVDKTKTVDNLTGTNASDLFNFGLTASIFVLKEAVMKAETQNGTVILDATAIQLLSNTGAVRFLNGSTIQIDKIKHKAVMNGSVEVAKLGEKNVVAINNLEVGYPAINTAQTSFELYVTPNGTIASNEIKLSLTGSNSMVKFASTTPITINNLDNNAEPTGYTATISLDKVTLEALKAPANELSKFVGSVNLNITDKLLDTYTNKRPTPLPTTIGLLGVFSTANGDSMDANLIIDTAESNPFVIPVEGTTRKNLYTYKYNSEEKSAYLTANTGKFFYYYRTPANETSVLKISQKNGCLVIEDNHYPNNIGCYGKLTVPESLAEMVKINPRDNINGWVNLFLNPESQGIYVPQFGASFNFSSTNNTLVDALALSTSKSFNDISEDANHFLKGTISLSTKAKLGTQEVSVNITAKRTTYGTNGNDGNGELMADILVGNDKLTLKAPVIGGVAIYTLTNKDNVSVEAKPIENQEKIEIKVGGKVAGWIYKVSGLPVAKFTDNSLMAL